MSGKLNLNLKSSDKTDADYLIVKNRNQTKQNQFQSQNWYYISLISEIGFAIALPIAIGAIFGSYLDNKFQTYPKWSLILIITGIIMSLIYFVKTVIKIINLNKKE